MRVSKYLALTAIFVVGMAFFIFGCYPRPAVQVPPKEGAVPDQFDLAEQDFRAGKYDEAIEKYERYLSTHPSGEKSRTALYRIARINYDTHQYGQALALFERIAREYPTHPELPAVEYDIASTFYRLGEYQRSEELASEWLRTHPTSLLKGEVLFLLGKALRAQGDHSKALYWWVKASQVFHQSPERMEEISDRITGLIKDSPIGELMEMAEVAAGSEYAPNIYYQMAYLYLEANQLDKAKSMAMALVRSTPEQYWVSAGRQILERIDEELSVEKGVLGCLLPLSGPFAIYGQEVLNGIQLGLGIFTGPATGQSLELIIKDTRGTEQGAVFGVEELAKEEKVMAIIGPLASKPTVAAAKKAQELGVPIITLTQKQDITAHGEMVFRNFLTPSREVKRLLEKVVNDMGLNRFAILYPDNTYGRFLTGLFWDEVERVGAEIRAVESYSPEQTDFAVEIKKMVGLHHPRPAWVQQTLIQKRSMEWENLMEEEQNIGEEPEPIVDFDAVFVPDNPQQVALIAPQFPFHNIFDVLFLGTSLWQSPELIETAGDYVQGAIFPSGFFTKVESNGVREFVQLYRENFESEPGILAASGYDTIRFIKKVLDGEVIRTRRDFQSRLSESDGFYGVTGKISFDQEGEVEKEPILLTISGKRFRTVPAVQ